VGGLELAQQEAAYAQTLATLPPLKKQLEQTRDLLAILCGQLPSDALPAASESEIQVPMSLPKIVPSQLAQYRPDIQAAQEQLHATFAQIGVAVANMYPQISIGANLAYNSSVLPGLLNPASQAWGALAGLTLPIFQGGTLSARRRAAEAAADAAKAQYQSVVLTAFQNVADTLYAIDQDGYALSTAEHLEAATAHQLDLTQNQFNQGYSSLLVLLSARQSYLQAKLAKEQSRSVYLGDTAALFQALGGGWQSDSASRNNL
jgi:NodT family efflux transporter outer membrane factor (OMF) lipoprotein